MRVAVPLVDLDREPNGRRDRQLIFGADVTVIERRHDRAFVQAAADGYCGWIGMAALTAERPAITHRVAAPATHIYPKATIKERESASLTLGARLARGHGDARRGAAGRSGPRAERPPRPAADLRR